MKFKLDQEKIWNALAFASKIEKQFEKIKQKIWKKVTKNWEKFDKKLTQIWQKFDKKWLFLAGKVV